MGLDEGWSGSCEPGFIGQGDIGRVPSCVSANAARVLESGEEFVSQEGIAVAAESIPLPRIEFVDAVMKT